MDYQNSKIYKIESITGEGLIYIGSTTKKYLSQRMAEHKDDYKKWKAGKKTKTASYDIFELYGFDNCKITLLENFECQTKDELNAREGYYIKTLDCVNKVVPKRTRKEYVMDNVESIKNTKKEYINKVGILKCDCGGKYLNEPNKKERHFETIKHTDWSMNQVD